MANNSSSGLTDDVLLVNATQLGCEQLLEQFRLNYPIEQWKTEGFFTEDDLLDINCHWLQFQPQKPYSHFSLAVLYVFLFTVGSVSNVTVIYILVSCRSLRSPANMLLINLAVSDLMLMMMIPMFIYNSFMQGPAFGRIGCALYGFLGGLNGTVSIMTLSAIAVDRYLVLSRPLDVTRRPTYLRVFMTIVGIWIYSAIFASLPLFGYGKYVPEGYLTSCSYDYLADDYGTRIFILSFFVAAWVVPLSAIAYCYIVIVRAVNHIRKDVTRHAPINKSLRNLRDDVSCHTARGVNQPDVEVTIAKIVIGLVTLWTITWTPYALVSLIGISGYGHILTPFDSMVPALVAKTAACIDPFVYSLNHPKIRNAIVYRIFRHFFVQRRGESGSDSTRMRDLKASLRSSRHLNHPYRGSLRSSRSRFHTFRHSLSSAESRIVNPNSVDLVETSVCKTDTPKRNVLSTCQRENGETSRNDWNCDMVHLAMTSHSVKGTSVEMISFTKLAQNDNRTIQVLTEV